MPILWEKEERSRSLQLRSSDNGHLPPDADEFCRFKGGDVIEDAIERLLQKLEVAADNVWSDEYSDDIFVEVASVLPLEQLPNEHDFVEVSSPVEALHQLSDIDSAVAAWFFGDRKEVVRQSNNLGFASESQNRKLILAVVSGLDAANTHNDVSHVRHPPSFLAR